jgi:hypothetical protein
VSTEQRENLEAVLRQSAFPAGSDVSEQRRDGHGTKREADPLLSRELLQSRVTDDTSGQDAALGLIRPVFADVSGLPP